MSLSNRVGSDLKVIMPKIEVQVAQRSSAQHYLDMGTAENWLIREELMAFFRRAIADNLVAEDLSYQKGFTGDPYLIGALCVFLNARFCPSQPLETHSICVGPGGGAILESLLATICDVDEGMLVVAPFWSGFHFQFKLQKVPIVQVDVPTHLALDESIVDYLEKALLGSNIRVKGVIICNPHNPLGRCYPTKTLEKIAQFCERHKLHLISDEVYALSVFASEDVPHLNRFCSVLDLDAPSLGISSTRLHVIWSVSKDLACNGLRVGVFASRNREAVVGVSMTCNTQVSCLSALAVRLLLSDRKALDEIISLNQDRLAVAYATVTSFLGQRNIVYFPAAAGVYVWTRLCPRIKTWKEEGRLAHELAQQLVIVSPGQSYASSEPGWYRLTFTLMPQALSRALSILGDVLDKFEVA